MRPLILGNLLGGALWLALVAILATACSRTPAPKKPGLPAVEGVWSCFILDSPLGYGLVCAERNGPCEAVKAEVEKNKHVSRITDCTKLNVTATQEK